MSLRITELLTGEIAVHLYRYELSNCSIIAKTSEIIIFTRIFMIDMFCWENPHGC